LTCCIILFGASVGSPVMNKCTWSGRIANSSIPSRGYERGEIPSCRLHPHP
jgi:hypothetical protein